MTRRLALWLIAASMFVIGLGYASAFLPGGAPTFAAFAFAIATAAVIAGILLLGAARSNGPLGGLKWVILFVFVVLAGGFCAALLLNDGRAQRLWLGLPAGAAIILYIVGFLPMLVLPLAYALTFERTLGEHDMDQLRAKLAELRQHHNARDEVAR